MAKSNGQPLGKAIVLEISEGEALRLRELLSANYPIHEEQLKERTSLTHLAHRLDVAIADVQPLHHVQLFAWLGEDEHGSGEIGLKQALCPAGYIPMAMTKLHKADQGYIRKGLQAQADTWRKTISLARFRFVEELIILKPHGEV